MPRNGSSSCKMNEANEALMSIACGVFNAIDGDNQPGKGPQQPHKY